MLDIHFTVFPSRACFSLYWYSFTLITEAWIIKSTHRTLQGLLIWAFNESKSYNWVGERKHSQAMTFQDTSRCSSSGSFLSHTRYNLHHLPASVFRAINIAPINTGKLLTLLLHGAYFYFSRWERNKWISKWIHKLSDSNDHWKK